MGGDHQYPRNVAACMQFQSTPPHGGRRPAPAPVLPTTGFNPRPRMGGDLTGQRPKWTTWFQSTPPHGGRLVALLLTIPPWSFQSTPPHGGRPLKGALPRAHHGFNPRPRMGGDFHDFTLETTGIVSIHAPAWGATFLRDTLGESDGFNPRPRMGGDFFASRRVCSRAVSIHAPAWGATAAGDRQRNGQGVSIHAPAWGATSPRQPVTNV